MRNYRHSSIGPVAALIALLLADAPANAGFLEELFGVEEAPQAAAPVRAKPARKRARDNFSIRTLDERPPARSAKSKAEPDSDADKAHGPYVAGSRPQKAALCAAAAQADQSTAYLRDETLRAGDSVVTESAIVVFKGNHACPHSASDFVSVARADLPKTKRNALAALEQSMRSPRRGFVLDAVKADKIAGRNSQ